MSLMPYSFRPRFDVFRFACLASPASLRSRGDCWFGDAAAKHVKVRVHAGLGAFVRDDAMPARWGGFPPYALWGPAPGSWFPLPYFLLLGIIGKNSTEVFLGLSPIPGYMGMAFKSWHSFFPPGFPRRSVLSPQKMRGGVVREGCDASVMRYDRNVSVRT